MKFFCFHRYVLTTDPRYGYYVFKCVKCGKEVEGQKGVLGIFYTGRAVCRACYESNKQET